MEVKEIWKDVPNAKGYKISNLGRLIKPASKSRRQRICSEFFKDKDGYCRVNIIFDNSENYTQCGVHRLVALAFIPNPDNKECVNHIDNNRTNNKVENLEWVTPRENVHHSYLKGNRKKTLEVPKHSVITEFQKSMIDELRKIYSLKTISKLFNVDYQTLKNYNIKRYRYMRQSERLGNQQGLYNMYNSSETIPEGSTSEA